MDICLQVMFDAPPHTETGDPYIDNNVFHRGDIVGVYKNSECLLSPSPTARSIFIRVTGVPITAIRKIKHIREYLVSSEEQGESEMIAPWYIPRIKNSDLPSNVLNTLTNKRELTLTWSRIKDEVVRKINNSYISDEDIS